MRFSFPVLWGFRLTDSGRRPSETGAIGKNQSGCSLHSSCTRLFAADSALLLVAAEGNVCIARSTVAYRAGKCFGVVAVEAAIDIVFPRTRARDVAEFTVAQDIGIFEINPFGTARQFAAQFAAAVAVIGSKHAGEEVVASRCVLAYTQYVIFDINQSGHISGRIVAGIPGGALAAVHIQIGAVTCRQCFAWCPFAKINIVAVFQTGYFGNHKPPEFGREECGLA